MSELKICKLCKKQSGLRNSHIIPEFFYGKLYDKNHRYETVDLRANLKIKKEQKGVREPLLCENCETYLSGFEQYASQIIYHRNDLIDENHFLIARNINYKKFKLFELSILWRASISGLPMFSRIMLGPHEEKIRLMILKGEPGKSHEYGCVINIYQQKNCPPLKIIEQPDYMRDNGFGISKFVFGGFVWVFVTSSHNEQYFLKQYFLQENGTLMIGNSPFEYLPHIPKIQKMISDQLK